MGAEQCDCMGEGHGETLRRSWGVPRAAWRWAVSRVKKEAWGNTRISPLWSQSRTVTSGRGAHR